MTNKTVKTQQIHSNNSKKTALNMSNKCATSVNIIQNTVLSKTHHSLTASYEQATQLTDSERYAKEKQKLFCWLETVDSKARLD